MPVKILFSVCPSQIMQDTHHVIDFFTCIVKSNGRTYSGLDTKAPQDRLGTVVSCPDGDAFFIECLANFFGAIFSIVTLIRATSYRLARIHASRLVWLLTQWTLMVIHRRCHLMDNRVLYEQKMDKVRMCCQCCDLLLNVTSLSWEKVMLI